MGVYISGLEIPPKGKGVVVILCSSGAVYLDGQKVGTAVPVPPIRRQIGKYCAGDYKSCPWATVLSRAKYGE